MTPPDSLGGRARQVGANLEACKAVERFLHRLRRSEPDTDLDDPGIDLSSVEEQLQALTENSAATKVQDVADRLNKIEADLLTDAAKLSAQDSRVAPSELRRFLNRVRRLDEQDLLHLIRFYIFSRCDQPWDSDVIDKVDFALSRLGEAVSGPLLKHDSKRLRSLLDDLWDSAVEALPGPEVVAAMRKKVQRMNDRLDNIHSLDELEEAALIPEYRALKHGMGRLLVEPTITESVLATNARLGRTMQALYSREEWGIAAGFARFAEIEQEAGFSEALSIELESLRRDMERIEKGKKEDDVRFDAVQRMRRQVESLLPHVSKPAAEDTDSTPEPSARSSVEPVLVARPEPERAAPTAPPAVESPAAPAPADLSWEVFSRLFNQLESLLAASASIEEADDVLQDPGLPFGLERREVAAFITIRDEPARKNDLDRMVLTAASLRILLRTFGDRFEAGAGQEIVGEANAALSLAEKLLRRFSEEVMLAESRRDSQWASEAQFLKVLLMRDYAELWLEVRGDSE